MINDKQIIIIKYRKKFQKLIDEFEYSLGKLLIFKKLNVKLE